MHPQATVCGHSLLNSTSTYCHSPHARASPRRRVVSGAHTERLPQGRSALARLQEARPRATPAHGVPGHHFRRNMLLILDPSRFFGCAAREGCRHSSAVDELSPSSVLCFGLAPCTIRPCSQHSRHGLLLSVDVSNECRFAISHASLTAHTLAGVTPQASAVGVQSPSSTRGPHAAAAKHFCTASSTWLHSDVCGLEIC